MKFSVSSSELLKKLQVASGAIGSNPVLPILEDFLFVIQENTLTITATNLETTIVTSMDVNEEIAGSVAVPAKILLDTLKALPDQPISFILNVDNNAIELTSAFGKYKLAGEGPGDYPETPLEEDTNSVTLTSDILSKAINKTLFATSNDELRLAMTGVYVQIDFNKIIFVATDAHKLIKYTFGNLNSDLAASFIIPKKAMTLIKNALGGSENVELSYNKTNAFFQFGETKIICRLIDAKYPDYNAVIPVDNPNEMLIGKKDFQNSLTRIAIYANKTTNQVVLNINDGALTISAQDLDFSNEATEQLPCTYAGDAMNIGFNAKFLIEMLNVIESDEVKLEMSTPSRAGILLPTEEDDNEQLLMLVMPVMMSH
jgi:DNA polymerase-3 subunit beta